MNIRITYMWLATMFDIYELQFLVTIPTSILYIFVLGFRFLVVKKPLNV